jgi:uncharacterized membrane protein YeaQ/YmgE (transglycosylase-associated protein family)
MYRAAYNQGCKTLLVKLGLYPGLLGGAVLGGVAGRVLAPEDRKGQGFLMGAVAGGAGGALGHKLSPALLDDAARANPGTLAKNAPAIGGSLGALSGLGLSQAYLNKKVPDTAEDPYHYFPQ